MIQDVLFKKFTASMSNILKKQQIKNKIVVALSGGVDSIVVLDLLCKYKAKYMKWLEIHAITVDHGLREESSWEAEQVRKEINDNKKWVKHSILHISDKIDPNRIEEHARELRYSLMWGYYRQISANAIFMGHHRDDQWETFLMRLLGGSTLWGLCGMRAVSNGFMGMKVCRPLLDVSKEEIYEYARSRGLKWFEDASNANTQLTMRNWLRALLARDGRLQETVGRLHGDVVGIIDGMVRQRMDADAWAARATLDPMLMRMELRVPIGDMDDVVGVMAVDRWIYEELWRVSPSGRYLHAFTRFDGKNAVVVPKGINGGKSLWEGMVSSRRGKKTVCGCVLQWETEGGEIVVYSWRERPHHGDDVVVRLSESGDRFLYDQRVYMEVQDFKGVKGIERDLNGLEVKLLHKENMQILWMGADLLQDLIVLLLVLNVRRPVLWESNVPVVVVPQTGEVVGVPTLGVGLIGIWTSPKGRLN